jgi:hypothetical protein
MTCLQLEKVAATSGTPSQQRVHQTLEIAERLPADNGAVIDQESRGARKMATQRVLQVMVYLRLVLAGFQAGLEPGGIQSHLGRVAFQIGLAQGWRPFIQQVVVFPELALIERTLAGFGGLRRFGDGVGKIAPDDLKLVAVLSAELF